MEYQIRRLVSGYFVLCWVSLGRLLTISVRLSNLFHSFIARQIIKTGLFDPEFYDAQHKSKASGYDGLFHFVAIGDRQGLLPSPVFDPSYYRSQASRLLLSSSCNSILHYILIGRHFGKSPSPHFDLKHYLKANPDVANSGMDPLLHFLRHGGGEGRNPSRLFDSAQYLSEHQEADRQKINPLVHFLTSNCTQDGSYSSLINGGDSSVTAGLLNLPPCSEWSQILVNRQNDQHPLVDVIVPVYKNKSLTLQCIYSVLASNQLTPFELIVINDASPEEDLVFCLKELALQGLITLLENEGNQGYVYSANRGMTLHSDRDVVQLNSDTEVFNDWLDRLRACAYQDNQTGTITPLSNNATICSYPAFNRDNVISLELTYPELDNLAASINSGASVETPTGVGFCMYIRRNCIEAIGIYDQDSFGRGYGEENDFCQRAQKRGWRNLIACDVFVRHYGSASFQGDRADLVAHAMQMINKLHPHYHKDVSWFVSSDPMAQYRRRLDEARRNRQVMENNVLLLSHNLGGGTERFVREEANRLENDGYGVFIMRPYLDDSYIVTPARTKDLINIPPFELDDCDRFLALTKELKIKDIQFHHMLGLDVKVVGLLIKAAQESQIKIKVYIHDYLAICPRINLVDDSSIYCGEPPAEQCNVCLRHNGSRFGVLDIVEWRQQFYALFRVAEVIVVPDIDVSKRLKKYFMDIDFEVKAHESPEDFPVNSITSCIHSEGKIKIVAIGAISQIKGFDVLLACAEDAQKRHLPLEFVVLGYTVNDAKAVEMGISVTGKYSEDDGLALLKEINPHAVFLPSVWPETYSYTLSLALKFGVPVFAFDLGAISSRLKVLGNASNLISLNSLSKISELNDWLIKKCQKNDF